MLTVRIKSDSEGQTLEIAGELAAKCHGGEVIALYGDLGSGKTLFTRGLAIRLGIEGKKIKSPTFTLKREYDLKDHFAKKFIHFDLYRILDADEAILSSLEESWQDPRSITVIEWADRLNEVLPENRIDVEMTYLSENEREIVIRYFPSHENQILGNENQPDKKVV